ncbi:MAG: hypothetical protein HUJ76_07020 [Parasporobacterium sp.]|nr:hypothetical protein [Parasporobacterium sp.]
MKFAEKLYFGKQAEKEKKEILKNLRSGRKQIGVYVVCAAANNSDLLDIIPSLIINERISDRMKVAGIAVSRREAVEVCRDIVMDCYAQTAGYDIRSFIC